MIFEKIAGKFHAKFIRKYPKIKHIHKKSGLESIPARSFMLDTPLPYSTMMAATSERIA